MRLRLLATSCLLVAVSAGGVKTLAASPDCARWVKEYQQGLAKRAAGAKRHVVRAARHLGMPHVRLVHTSTPVHRLRPAKLSPQEMLKRFRVLCGEDLPEDTLPVAFVPTGLEEALVPSAPPLDTTSIVDLSQPAALPLSQPTDATGGTAGVTPTAPILIASSGTPNGSTGTGTGSPAPPIVIPNAPVVTPSPAPEPSSLLLLVTGLIGAVPAVKRRLRS